MPTRIDSSLKHQAKAGSLVPSAIFKEIEAQPPLMRPELVRQYIGMDVDWPATLADAREQRPGEIHVVGWSTSRGNRLIVVDVPFSAYPHLKTVRVNDPFRVKGKIKRIDAIAIELEIAELLFASQATASR